MNPFFKLRCLARQFFGWWTLQRTLVILLGVLVGLFVAVAFSEDAAKHVSQRLGIHEKEGSKNETLKFLGIGMGGILVALQALASHKRAKAMEDAANAQARATLEQTDANRLTEQGQRQERLKNAIEHLGHESDSVRMGGAYELFHLARDTQGRDAEALRQTVLDILCAHIRWTTGEDRYRKKHRWKPSEEVQSLLTLLFVRQYEVFEDLQINLQGSWLNGADLWKGQLQGADLNKAHLQKASLVMAHLQGAFLNGAQLQAANLDGAQMEGTFLSDARLQGASLDGTQLQAALLIDTQLQGAFLGWTRLQGTYLIKTQLQGAFLAEAHLQGAFIRNAHLQGAGDVAWSHPEHFENRIRTQINRESNLSKVIFAGGLSQEDLDALVEGLSDDKAKKLRETLKPHIDQPVSNKLPENSGAITGAYTAEEAEQWIAEYEEAMSDR